MRAKHGGLLVRLDDVAGARLDGLALGGDALAILLGLGLEGVVDLDTGNKGLAAAGRLDVLNADVDALLELLVDGGIGDNVDGLAGAERREVLREGRRAVLAELLGEEVARLGPETVGVRHGGSNKKPH